MALKKRKKKHAEELCSFEKMSVLGSDEFSLHSSSSKDGQIKNIVLNKKPNINKLKHSGWKLKQYSEIDINLDDCIHVNYSYDFFRSCLVSQPNLKTDKNIYNSNSPTQEDLVPITFDDLIPKVEGPLNIKN